LTKLSQTSQVNFNTLIELPVGYVQIVYQSAVDKIIQNKINSPQLPTKTIKTQFNLNKTLNRRTSRKNIYNKIDLN
jgi:hypothetical protein